MTGITAEVAEQVASVLKETRVGLQGMLEKVAELRVEMRSLREDVRSLSRIILEGNGQEPMMARVTVLDREVREVKTWIEEQREQHRALRRDQLRRRWHLLTAATPGLITLLWSILSFITQR